MNRDVLYENDKVKITYLHNLEPEKQGEVISCEDHEMLLRDARGEWKRHILQRGVLEDLSRRAYVLSDLMNRLNRIDPFLLEDMGRKISLEDISLAVLGARKKEEEELKEYLKKQKIPLEDLEE